MFCKASDFFMNNNSISCKKTYFCTLIFLLLKKGIFMKSNFGKILVLLVTLTFVLNSCSDDSDVLNIDGYTWLDAHGNRAGELDDRDWKFNGDWEGRVMDIFGVNGEAQIPEDSLNLHALLFPNPCSFQYATLGVSFPEGSTFEAKMINRNAEVIWSYPGDSELDSVGNNYYRVIVDVQNLRDAGLVRNKELVRMYYRIDDYRGYGDFKIWYEH
jgi:hypothetical protein